MKILHPKAAGLVGMVAAVTVTGQANAQSTASVTMGVNMTISQAAIATSTAMSFGSVSPLPNNSVVLGTNGVVTGGLASSGSPTAGIITVTRNAAITVAVTPPSSLSMTCGGADVTIDTFTTAAGGVSCTTAATTACTIQLGATARFPSTTLSTGACTQATATMTLTYSN